MPETEEEFTNHLFTYRYQDEEWSFVIPATSKEDAEARLAQMQWARYEGDNAFMVPASMGWLARAYVWVRNLFGADMDVR